MNDDIEAGTIVLPDTPLNRRLLRAWANQDDRGARLQKRLFSADPDISTPDPTDLKTFSTSKMTFKLQPAAEISDDAQPDPRVLDDLIVSRMNSGSSSSRTESGESIFLSVMAIPNLESEFSSLYEAKKNRSACIAVFVEYLKKKHPTWNWPKKEEGTKLRDLLAALATQLRAEYPAPPKIVAAVEMYALFLSDHKSDLLSDFHSSLCYSDEEFSTFQDLCALGELDDSRLRFAHATMLPGFARFSCEDSDFWWVSTAAAVVDSIAFVDIKRLETEAEAAVKEWTKFAIRSRPPKNARSTEMQLHSVMIAACERASLVAISEIDRAQRLLDGIALKVNVQDRVVAVSSMIRDEIAAAKMGKAAVTRDFVFERYCHYYEFASHAAHAQGEPAAQPTNSQPGDTEIKCRDCSTSFIFSAGQKAWYKARGMDSIPTRCDSCNSKNKALLATKPCPQFDRGSCSAGSSCRMMHGGTPPNNNSVPTPGPRQPPIVITCRDCKGKFEEEKEKWDKLGFSLPKSCSGCRRNRKPAEPDTVLICDEIIEERPANAEVYCIDEDDGLTSDSDY
jgi:hypothetical protein